MGKLPSFPPCLLTFIFSPYSTVYGWETTEFVGPEREEQYSVEIVLRKGLLDLFFSGLRYDVVLAAGGNASKTIEIIIVVFHEW